MSQQILDRWATEAKFHFAHLKNLKLVKRIRLGWADCFEEVLDLPQIPFNSFHQCNIVTLGSKLATISIRQVHGSRLRERYHSYPGTACQGLFEPDSPHKI